MLGPHNREDAKLRIVRLASKQFDYPIAFFVVESVTSNQFRSDGRFGHIGGPLEERRRKRLTDMLLEDASVIKLGSFCKLGERVRK